MVALRVTDFGVDLYFLGVHLFSFGRNPSGHLEKVALSLCLSYRAALAPAVVVVVQLCV